MTLTTVRAVADNQEDTMMETMGEMMFDFDFDLEECDKLDINIVNDTPTNPATPTPKQELPRTDKLARRAKSME